jgi:hypothetical protein
MRCDNGKLFSATLVDVHCLVPPGVTFFVTKESNQRKSCEIESPEGRPGTAGSEPRDFDGTDYTLKEASKSQILFVRPHQGFVSISRTMFDRSARASDGKHRNHETCVCPLAMCFAIAQCSDLLILKILFGRPHERFVSISRSCNARFR